MKVSLLALLGLVALNACTSRNPLDSTPKEPQANTITVSVLSGSTPSINVRVFLRNATIDEVATTDFNGKAVFAAKGTGTFEVGFSDQYSTTPVKYIVPVLEGTVAYSITLQQSGAAFAVSAPVGQGNGYQFGSTSKSWNITYLNNSDQANDLAISLDSGYPAPSGWTVTTSPPVLRKGETAVLSVVVPQGSQVGNATHRILGKTSTGTTILQSDVIMPQEWSFKVRREYTTTLVTEARCYGSGDPEQRLTEAKFTAQAVGVPAGYIVEFIPLSSVGSAVSPGNGSSAWVYSGCHTAATTQTGWLGAGLLFNPGLPATSITGNFVNNDLSYGCAFGTCHPTSGYMTVNSSFKIGGTTVTYADVMTAAQTKIFP